MSQTDVDQWAQAGTQALQQTQAEQVRSSVQQALPVNPDQEAQARRFATAAQVPLDTARALPDVVKQKAQMSTFDADLLARQFPKTSQLLVNPDNAKLLHDDIPTTAGVERAVKALPAQPPQDQPPSQTSALSAAIHYIFSTPGSGDTLIGDAGKVVLGGARALASTAKYGALAASTLDRPVDAALDTNYQEGALGVAHTLDEFAQGGPTKQASFKDQLLNVVGSTAGVLGEAAATGGTSVPARAGAGVLEALAPHVAHGVQAMTVPSAVAAQDTYQKVLAQTQDPAAATKAALTAYVTSTLGGVVPFATPGKLAVRAATGAVTGTLLGDVSHTATNLSMPDSMQAPPRDGTDRALDAVMGAMFGGMAGPKDMTQRLNAAVRQSYTDAAHAEASLRAGEALSQLGQLSALSKLRERDPDAFKAFVNSVTEDGHLSEVYVDAKELTNALNQSGVTPAELQSVLPELQAQLHEASQTNGDVRIPVADYATHIAGTDIDTAILPHLKADPDGATYAQAQEFYKDQVDGLKASADKIVAEHVDSQAAGAARDKVREQVLQQLNAVPQLDPRGNVHRAEVMGDYYTTMAARSGMTPEQFMQTYPVRFSDTRTVGGLDQGEHPASDIATTLLELGKQERLFRYPKSTSTDLAEIAAAKGLKVTPVDRNSKDSNESILAHTTPEDGQSWMVKLPGGGKATLSLRGKELHINASALKEGGGGSRLYDLAANFAHNNGLKFIGDPNGISEAALRRRLENMLSSAVKYGTTDHIAPHPDQETGRLDLGIPALRWRDGDTLANIRAMVEASIATTEATHPNATANVRFDPATQSFVDGSGAALDHEAVSGMLGFDERQPRTGAAGRTTLQRAALLKSLLSGPDARRRVLESVRGGNGDGSAGIGGSFYQGAVGQRTIELGGVRRPIEDANGRLLGRDFKEQQNFWKWFGDSKVVDEHGRPLAVYHGTDQSFDEFRGNSYFTPVPEDAATYSAVFTPGAAEHTPNVVPAYLSFRKPKVIPVYATRADIDDARDSGKYDGVIVRGVAGSKIDHYIAFTPEQVKSAIGNNGNFNPNDASILHQPAYHGSPHDFDRFSTDKIGLGEGHQAFGYGLYFAEAEGVARQYADNVKDMAKVQRLNAEMSELAKVMGDDQVPGSYRQYRSDAGRQAAARYDELMAKRSQVSNAPGKVYQVEIPDDVSARMLLWDKPLSEQPQSVQEALKKARPEFFTEGWMDTASGLPAPDAKAYGLSDEELNRKGFVVGMPADKITGERFYTSLAEEFGGAAGRNAYTQRQASEYLDRIGVPGIKYLDAGSRTSSEGTKNLVVFNDKNVTLTHKDGSPVTQAERDEYFQGSGQHDQEKRGQINFGDDITKEPTVISLFKTADLSTFHHETAHFFLEVQADLAAKIEARMAAGEAVSPGEQGIAKDFETALAALGMKPAKGKTLAQTWQEMPLEGRSAGQSKAPGSGSTGGRTARSRAFDANPFKAFIAKHGISLAERSEFAPGVTEQRKAMVPGYGPIFRRTGEPIDTLVQFAIEEGFLPRDEADGDTKLRSMIADALGGKRIIPQYAEGVAEQEMQARIDQHEELQDLSTDDLRESGYVAFDHDLQARVRELMAQAEAGGIDVESLLEDVAKKDQNASQDEYHLAARQALEGALADTGSAGTPDGSRAADAQGAEPQGKAEGLISQDEDGGLAQSSAAEPLDGKREYHEKFARSYEAYLLEGKAPSVGLARAFQAFRSWMISVYRSLTGVGERPSPELKGVFDRMLASDDAIKVAEQVRGYRPMFESAQDAGMTLEEFARYQQIGKDATADAIDELQARSLRDMKWLSNGKSKIIRDLQREAAGKRREIREQVTKEVDEAPAFAAKRFLDDAKTDGPTPDLQIVADKFGFDTPDEMLRAIAERGNRKDIIEGLTDQRMLEEHGDLVDPSAIERAAEAAIHNEARARFVAAELKALAKATSPARQLALAAKEAADAAIAAKKVGDLRPAQYTAAEGRAARAAEKALAAGDLAAAASEKRAQLLNNRLAKAATDAVEQVRKDLVYLKKFDKAGIRGKLPGDFVERIDDIRGALDLRQNPPEGNRRAEALLGWADGLRKLGYEPQIADWLNEMRPPMSYKEASVEQFRGVVDAVRSLEHIARAQKEVTVEGKKLALDQVVATLTARMDQRGQKFSKEQLIERPAAKVDGVWRSVTHWLGVRLRMVHNDLTPQEFKFNKYDLHELEGPFRKTLFDPIIEANYRKVDLLKRQSDMGRAVGEALGKDWQKSLYEGVKNARLTDPDLSTPGNPVLMKMTRGRMLGIARHVGNESNFEKLTRGYGWNGAEVWSFLHANMTAKDWQATQAHWDSFDPLWKESEAMIRRQGGVPPPKIPAREFDTPHGKMRGGYSPLDYDPLRSRLSVRMGEFDLAPGDKVGEQMLYRATTTHNSSMVSRSEGYSDRVNLDFHSTDARIRDTIHDLAYREALLDAGKVVRDAKFRQKFMETYGREEYQALNDWLAGVRDMNVSDPRNRSFEKAMQYSRQGVVLTGIGYRVSTVLKHGGAAALKSLGYLGNGEGAKYFAARVARMASGHLQEDLAAARDKFPEIRARMLQMDRDFKAGNRSMYETEGWQQKNDRFGHAMVAWSDALSATPTAWAAYDLAKTSGVPVSMGGTGKPMSEEAAVKYASSVVRQAHGTALEATRSNFMQSRGAKGFFGALYGFMNNTYGQTADMLDKSTSGGYFRNNPAVAARLAATLLVPALWTQWLKDGGPDDQHDPWYKWAGKAIAGEVGAMVPFVRDAVALLEYGRGGTIAPMQMVTDAVNSGKDLWDEAHGKQTRLIQDLANAMGEWAHIAGLGQLGHILQYMRDVSEGKKYPQSEAQAVKEAVIGGAAKH